MTGTVGDRAFACEGDWSAVVGSTVFELMADLPTGEMATVDAVLRDGPRDFLTVASAGMQVVIERADDEK